MPDRRKEKREKLTAFTPVYDLNADALLGYLADLNLQGVRVNGEHAMDIGMYLRLGIEFPKNTGITPSRLVVPARVARCHGDEESPAYHNIGLEFTETTPDQERVIKEILRRYRF